ncbi:hypothetical protein PsYK624_061860 [Phanerochaete sordida]|uniref:Uncharacterized protein n=1 Tax=Phanerochaete sordida TaxID=48140 RepID=A0A9P3G6B2_9APHY|nr:hypothetical protein PsYK624_061860 [Phanerochaete sordida]
MSLDATSGLDLITDPYLPALKTLKCYHYPNWPVFKTWLKPTLTELEIDGYDSFLSLTIDDWVGALRPLSSLRKLSLVNTFDSLQADSSTHYSTEPIYLPHLKTLSVVVASRSAFDACSHLRDLIRSPWCTEVDVRISGKYRGDGSPAIEARTDSQFLASMAQNTAKALRRAEEAQSVLSMVFEWASYHLSMTVQEVGGDAERKLLEVHLYLPNHVLPYCRPDLEALVAHTVAACPALCGAAILVLLNLGVERRTWDGISVASVPRLLICRESLPAFLDAMEDDPATFMQQLEIMNLFNFDTRFRAPPQPTDEEWQEQRLLSQRVADVLDQRWKLGLGPYSVDLGERWGSIEI